MFTAKDYEYIVGKLKTDGIFPHQQERILYKYASAEEAIKILSGSSLLYQTPVKFNDPFDLHMGLLDLTHGAYKMLWERMNMKGIYTHKQMQLVMETVTDLQMMGEADKVMLEGREKMGILCMSHTNLSTLMWSHYSKKHQGVCLGFRIPNGAPDLKTVAFSVNYASEVIPRKFIFEHADLNDMYAFYRWICTKANVWHYEEEVRVINLTEMGIIPFEIPQLCEVYYGVATEQSHIEVMDSHIASKGYVLEKKAKMKINRNTFELEPIFH